jgi:adenylylsulfate kinase-like enzyme
VDKFDIKTLDNNIVIIMRGLPGSGKSTFVNTILTAANEKNILTCVCSADHFFVNENGKYVFDPRYLRQAHNACAAKFAKALCDKIPIVIVDNTNTTRWEYEQYVKQALDKGYIVKLKEITPQTNNDIITFYERCLHNVPLKKLEEMAARWQRDDTLNKL